MKKHFYLLLFLPLGTLAQSTKYVNAENLNLRESPTTDSKVLAVLHAPTPLRVEALVDDKWAAVVLEAPADTIRGYVATQNLVDEVEQVSVLVADPTLTVSYSHPKPALVSLAKSKPTKPQEPTVYLCDGGSAYAYHSSSSCSGLNRCTHEVSAVSRTIAENRYGRSPCKKCY